MTNKTNKAADAANTSTALVPVKADAMAKLVDAWAKADRGLNLAEKKYADRVADLFNAGVRAADIEASGSGKQAGRHYATFREAWIKALPTSDENKRAYDKWHGMTDEARAAMDTEARAALKKAAYRVPNAARTSIGRLRKDLAALENAATSDKAAQGKASAATVTAATGKASQGKASATTSPETMMRKKIFELFVRIHKAGDKPELVALFGKDGYAKAMAEIESLNKRVKNPSRADAAFK